MMNIDLKDTGGIILIVGAFIALAQELWYVDNGFNLYPLLSTFIVPIFIMIIGVIVSVYAWSRTND